MNRYPRVGTVSMIFESLLRVPQFPPQNRDRSCERILLDEAIRPDAFQQFPFVHQVSRPPDQQRQHAQGLWFQCDALSAAAEEKLSLTQLKIQKTVARHSCPQKPQETLTKA